MKKKKDESWKKEWQDMPEFKMKDLTSFRKIVVHFRNQKDIDDFAKLIKQKITNSTENLELLISSREKLYLF